MSPLVIERALRGIAVGRANWLFCGSPEGGRRAAVMYSIIESCKAAGAEPYAYLNDVLERLPTAPSSTVPDLTPAAWVARRS